VASFRLSRVFYAWGGFRSAAVVEFLVRRRCTCRWFQAKQRDEGLSHCHDMTFRYRQKSTHDMVSLWKKEKKRSKYVGKNVRIFPSRKAPHQHHHICVDLPSFHRDMPIRQTRMGATTRARARPRTHLSNQARHKTSRLPHFAK
jgi:hypothetical protein